MTSAPLVSANIGRVIALDSKNITPVAIRIIPPKTIMSINCAFLTSSSIYWFVAKTTAVIWSNKALKESYTDLERKVEDRTRRERQRAEQLRTINEVGRKISSIVKLDELLPYVGNLLRETFHYYNVNIFLLEPSSGKLALKALCLSGQKSVIPVGVPLEVDQESIVGWVAQTGEPILANDVSENPRYRAVEALRETKSELAVPVRIGGKVIGVLDIKSTDVDAFGESDLYTAQTLADQLAVAIDNARLYDEP